MRVHDPPIDGLAGSMWTPPIYPGQRSRSAISVPPIGGAVGVKRGRGRDKRLKASNALPIERLKGFAKRGKGAAHKTHLGRSHTVSKLDGARLRAVVSMVK